MSLDRFKSEKNTLAKFHAAWEKPFTEIVQGFYRRDPQAGNLLHVRLRKPLAADDKTVTDTYRMLDERKVEEFELEKDTLWGILNTYLFSPETV